MYIYTHTYIHIFIYLFSESFRASTNSILLTAVLPRDSSTEMVLKTVKRNYSWLLLKLVRQILFSFVVTNIGATLIEFCRRNRDWAQL